MSFGKGKDKGGQQGGARKPETPAPKKPAPTDPNAVTVVCGANRQVDAALVGQTVDAARTKHENALNIAKDATAQIAGSKVDGKRVLRTGEVLEFIRTGGSRG